MCFYLIFFNQKITPLRLKISFQVSWPRQAAVAYGHTQPTHKNKKNKTIKTVGRGDSNITDISGGSRRRVILKYSNKVQSINRTCYLGGCRQRGRYLDPAAVLQLLRKCIGLCIGAFPASGVVRFSAVRCGTVHVSTAKSWAGSDIKGEIQCKIDLGYVQYDNELECSFGIKKAQVDAFLRWLSLADSTKML